MTRIIPPSVIHPETAPEDPHWAESLAAASVTVKSRPRSFSGFRRRRVFAEMAAESALRWARVQFEPRCTGSLRMHAHRSAESPTLASFDLDAVSDAEAPGVSAPNTGGLTSDLWIEAAFQAGRSPAVSSADVVELNPSFDRDGQTAAGRCYGLVAPAWQV